MSAAPAIGAARSTQMPDCINPQPAPGLNRRIWDRQERVIWWYARLGKINAAAKLAQVSCTTQERVIWWYARLGKINAAAKLAQVSCTTVDGWRRLDKYGVRGRMDDARAEFLRGRALIDRR